MSPPSESRPLLSPRLSTGPLSTPSRSKLQARRFPSSSLDTSSLDTTSPTSSPTPLADSSASAPLATTSPTTSPTLSRSALWSVPARSRPPLSRSGSLTHTQTPSAKAKGKQRALSPDPHASDDEIDQEDDEDGDDTEADSETRALLRQGKGKEAGVRITPRRRQSSLRGSNKVRNRDRERGEAMKKEERGRAVTLIFNDAAQANLEVWVEDGESVGHVKDQIRTLRPALASSSLRLIHAGRLLTDGILLLPWLRALEERVRRQAAGVGAEVNSVLRDVAAGLNDELGDDDGAGDHKADHRGDGVGGNEREKKEDKVWLHCIIGGSEAAKTPVTASAVDEEAGATGGDAEAVQRRRGFDVLLDAGLSADDVAAMRRQFYESRGEEVPDGLEAGDVNDEHARALEEQWIEGDLTAETATTVAEGMYTSILHGLLVGFLLPLTPLFFFRELPVPNFFDAEAEADAQALERARKKEEKRRARRDFSYSATATARGRGGVPPASAAGGGAALGLGLGAGLATAATLSPHAGSETAGSVTPGVSYPTEIELNDNLAPGRGGSDAPSPLPSPTPTFEPTPIPSPTPMVTDPASTGAAAAGGVLGATAAASLAELGPVALGSVVFGKRMQMGIILGTLLNLAFGALRLLN